MAGYPRTCACCRATVHGAMWDIVEPSGLRRLVCRVCGPHAELKASGELWLPPHCPAVAPRPRFRLLTNVEGE